MKVQERNKAFKQLTQIKERVEQGDLTQEDTLAMIEILMKLVLSVKIKH
ncbi:hypothetical protein [Bacillus infantis]|nr:hypothetical protein [Bacillus infantis]